MHRTAFLLALGLPISVSASSDGTDFSHSCWIGSVGFSKGASMRIAGEIMECSAEIEWRPSKKNAASGCVYNGEFFSEGAIRGATGAKVLLRCEVDGRWSLAPMQ